MDLLMIVYLIITVLFSMIGSLIVLKFYKWSEKNSFLIINFVAGIMLALAFIHLIPEGFEFNQKIMLWVLCGFLLMFLLQFIVLIHPCHVFNNSKSIVTDNVTLPIFFGLLLHSFIDGLIIAIGFEAGFNLGIITTVCIMAHKLPDGITIAGILIYKGLSKIKIFILSFVIAFFTPIGAISGIILFKNISLSNIGSMLGITAGSFIFISASDLIPETYKSNKKTITSIMLFIGVATVVIITKFIFI
jgi:ZIP family zinc transporter/zinc and cadmium transporter